MASRRIRPKSGRQVDVVPAARIRTFAALLFLMAILGALQWWITQNGVQINRDAVLSDEEKQQRIENLQSCFYPILFEEFGIHVEWMSGTDRTKVVKIPKDLPIVEPYQAIYNKLVSLDGRITKAESNEIGDKVVLEVAAFGETLLTIRLEEDLRLERKAGRIALVFDGFGSSLDDRTMAALQLPHIVSFAIVPGLQYSKQTAEYAVENQHGVLTRLALAAANGTVIPDAFQLSSGMRLEENSRRVRKAMAAVPKTEGLCMMTDAAPGVERQMANVIEIMRKTRSLYVEANTESTPAVSIARRRKVPYFRNILTVADITEGPLLERKMTELAQQAMRSGYVVAFVHLDNLDLEVIAKEMSRLRKRGYEFVKVSSLVN